MLALYRQKHFTLRCKTLYTQVLSYLWSQWYHASRWGHALHRSSHIWMSWKHVQPMTPRFLFSNADISNLELPSLSLLVWQKWSDCWIFYILYIFTLSCYICYICYRCLCRPCCLVGSIPLGNIGWLPGTPPSPYREERNQHLHYSTLSRTGAGQFYRPQFCQMPVGVSVDLTWLGNLSGGLGPPGYRGDMNGWKKTKR